MPIFSSNGTIALESASFGFYSILTGSRIDSQYCIKAVDIDSLTNYLNMSLNEIQSLISCPVDIIDSASILLLDTKSRCDLPNLFAKSRLQPWSTTSDKFSIACSFGTKVSFHR